MAKATRTKEAETQIADDPDSSGEVAVFSPPRLPYHPAVEEKFQVDRGQWKVLVEAIFPSAKSVDAIILALSYCKSRGLDVFKRPVHIVPLWDSQRGCYVESVWPGISELRTTASRTKGYAGVDEADFGPVKKVKFTGRIQKWVNRVQTWTDETVEMEFPEWCRLTVYRIVDGQRCKFVGPKVKWVETYATMGKSDLPNQMWQERPEGQLEKCAEAAALRRAFPEELGNELTAEEMAGRNLHEMLTTEEPAREPAGAPPGAAPSTASGAAARDTAPPRRAPAAEKPDPITSGPAKTDGPPRQVKEPVKETAKEPAKPAQSPAQETTPHKISGDGHSFESWTAKYCDLIGTSIDLPAAHAWIDLNRDPLTRLEKGRPSEFAKCRAAAQRTIDKLRAEAEKPAKPPASDMGGDMDDSGGDMFGDEPPQWPSDPEQQLKYIERRLSQATADTLEAIWDDMVAEHYDQMFPPDQTEAMAIYRRHEARVAP